MNSVIEYKNKNYYLEHLYLTDNYYLIHPSMAGASNCAKLRVTGRQQWFGQQDAPSLQTMSFNNEFDTDEEKIDEILRIVYVNLVNNTLNTTKSIMSNNFFEGLMGFQGKKNEVFRKIVNYVIRFENNEKKFYLYEEKKFKHISGIMMKKLSKLYSMAQDEKSSIKNWDLHHKINRTNENIQSEYKFKRI
jgi:hypothetical protein